MRHLCGIVRNCERSEPLLPERLLAVVCIAVVWAYLVGDHRDQCVKPIRILKNGRRAMSVVRYGLMEIESVLQRTYYKNKSDIFKFLSCT